MKTVVYLDVLIVVNLILDYFILLCVRLVSSDKTVKWRILIGATVASLTSLIILAPPLNTVLILLYKAVTAMLIVLISFKWQGKLIFLKRILWYIFFNICLAGFVILYRIGISANVVETNNLEVYFNISPIVLMLCVILVYVFMQTIIFLFGTPKKDIITAFDITVNATTFTVQTFWDTGFGLVDYLTQNPVIMVNYQVVTDADLKAELCDFFKNKNISENTKYKWRVLMVKTAASPTLLPCVTAQNIKLCGKKTSVKNLTVVFTDTKFENGYTALAGTQFMNSFGL